MQLAMQQANDHSRVAVSRCVSRIEIQRAEWITGMATMSGDCGFRGAAM
jgi:hypothetical protein